MLHRQLALAVDRLAERVDDAADQIFAHGHRDDPAGPLDRVALADALVRAQDDQGDGVLLEILRHAVGAVGKFHELVDHALFQSGRACNAVADRDDGADLVLLDFGFVILDLRSNDLCDLVRSKFHVFPAFCFQSTVSESAFFSPSRR